MNISSVIVYANSNNLEQLFDEIDQIKGCEVHLVDREKRILIVSIEAEGVDQEIDVLNTINALENVCEAYMHYSYSEEELEQAREEILGGVSAILDDKTPIEEIRYSGSVYNQMYKK